ncbi:MAG: CBS domain-containing protein [Candidatus Eremiobacteraeota bacterium]|nr:CBS domain-containing protein [Candidatus Eremiobacteraeota bacterium]
MKQLRTNLDELRNVLNQISVKHIAEEVKSVNENDNCSEVRDRMKDENFDIMPVRSSGVIIGYVIQSKLTTGICSQQVETIKPIDIVAESTPILKCLDILKDKGWLFILENNEIKYIVTKGDLRKAPVRMFLFALINLLEMHFTRMIRKFCDEGELESLLSEKRIEKAKSFYEDIRVRNEELDVFDCLQLCDKCTIIRKKDELFSLIGIKSKEKANKIFDKVEKLRNNIAHGYDIISGSSWSEVIEVSDKIESTINNCEEASQA